MSRYLPPRGYELIAPRPRYRTRDISALYDRHAAANLDDHSYNLYEEIYPGYDSHSTAHLDDHPYNLYEEIYPGYDSYATSYAPRQSRSREIYQDYQHGSHDGHGLHHGGSHEQDVHDRARRREGKRPAYETSTSQRPRHHDSGRSGGHRGDDYDEQMLRDQMLAMSLQQQEDEASPAPFLGEPHQHHGLNHHHSGSSREYSEYPRSRAHRYEYGEQSTSSFAHPGHGGRHRRHEDVSDPDLDYYDTAPIAPRDHHGGGSKSSSRKEPCDVCMEKYPVADLYKLCPTGKCPLTCADCTKAWFKSSMKSLPKKPVMCCNKIVYIDPVAHLFRPRFVKEYKELQMELDTTNKFYCSNKKCSAFIPPSSIIGANATCQKCGKQTCTRCKNASHRGEPCRSNPDDEQVKELGYRKGWKQCPGCGFQIAKKGGCDTIYCNCGTTWCYNCGRKGCDTQRCLDERDRYGFYD